MLGEGASGGAGREVANTLTIFFLGGIGMVQRDVVFVRSVAIFVMR